MKIVYSKNCEQKYPTNPIESPERVRLSRRELTNYEFVEPACADMKDIRRVHGQDHIERVIKKGLFRAASFAAGGAITAAELSLLEEPAFALIRPPGHHASANRSWGMCFFNNIAIAIERLRSKAGKVLILDIDLHFGDGTASIFKGIKDVTVENIGAVDLGFEYLKLDSARYIEEIIKILQTNEFDLIGVSAGFDTYIEDWGGLLSNKDYFTIGKVIREMSGPKRFAILEGGYHQDLRYNIKSFINGFA